MTIARFYQLLLIVFGVSLLLFQGAMRIFPNMSSYQNFFLIGQIFFVVLSIVSFYIGKKLTHHANKNVFSQFILMFILNKILFSIAIIVVYVIKTKPLSKVEAILPFLSLYLLYTAFNVYFLSKIGKE